MTIAETKNPLDRLTKSEKEVCRLVCQGLSNAEIAVKLSISTRTVEVHRFHAYKKLQLPSQTQLLKELYGSSLN